MYKKIVVEKPVFVGPRGTARQAFHHVYHTGQLGKRIFMYETTCDTKASILLCMRPHGTTRQAYLMYETKRRIRQAYLYVVVKALRY
jgi:hypothetical protein